MIQLLNDADNALAVERYGDAVSLIEEAIEHSPSRLLREVLYLKAKQLRLLVPGRSFWARLLAKRRLEDADSQN